MAKRCLRPKCAVVRWVVLAWCGGARAQEGSGWRGALQEELFRTGRNDNWVPLAVPELARVASPFAACMVEHSALESGAGHTSYSKPLHWLKTKCAAQPASCLGGLDSCARFEAFPVASRVGTYSRHAAFLSAEHHAHTALRALGRRRVRVLGLGDSVMEQCVEAFGQCTSEDGAPQGTVDVRARLFLGRHNFRGGKTVDWPTQTATIRTHVDLHCNQSKGGLLILANLGLHYGLSSSKNVGGRAFGLKVFRRDLGFALSFLRDLARLPGVAVLYVGTLTQHFATEDGVWDSAARGDVTGDISSYPCKPLPRARDATDIADLDWRDALALEAFHAEPNPPDLFFLPFGNLTRPLWDAKRGRPNAVDVDCTHVCAAPFVFEPVYWAIEQLLERGGDIWRDLDV